MITDISAGGSSVAKHLEVPPEFTILLFLLGRSRASPAGLADRILIFGR